MKLGRRGFLRLAAAAPVAAPLAAKEAVETATMGLSGILIGGPSVNFANAVKGVSGYLDVSAEQRKIALSIPHVRDRVRSIVAEDHKNVNSIDPDIAVYRSFSINAKIAFQRQRNVDAELERMQRLEWGHETINKLIMSALGIR